MTKNPYESIINKQLLVVKIIVKSTAKEINSIKKIKLELIILSTLSFPFILDLHSVFQSDKRLFLITE